MHPTSNGTASRKPKDSAFRQQRLPAWQPVMTAHSVIPIFFAIGVAFIPIGAVLLVTSNNVQEVIKEYTDCVDLDSGRYCKDSLNTSDLNSTGCRCEVNFTLSQDMSGDVYMYYGLSNFYQNHRRYVKSRDDNQLSGQVVTQKNVSTDCDPYRIPSNDSVRVYTPCGAIADSLFNDTLTLYYEDGSSSSRTKVNVTKTGIAWPSDKNVKFSNPTRFGNETLADAFKNRYNPIKPPNWRKNIWELDTETDSNNGYENEDLIVWMRTAALPDFRKLYRIVDRSNSSSVFANGLPKGNYVVSIMYSYPVTEFNGQKRVILTTTSWLGGKNPFLGIAYIVVGCICMVLTLVFFIIHVKLGKKEQEVIGVTDRTPY